MGPKRGKGETHLATGDPTRVLHLERHLERRAVQSVLSVDDLAVQEVASRALDRSAASASAWTRHTVQ